MANISDKESQQIKALISVVFGSERSEDLINDLKKVKKSSEDAESGIAKFHDRLSKLDERVSKAAGYVSKFTSVINAQNVSLVASVRASLEYRDAIASTFSQFAKYGTTINEYEQSIEKLRKQYGASYSDAIRFKSSLEKAFNVTGPNNLDKYLEGLSKTVGRNIRDVEALSNKFTSLFTNNPQLEDLLASGNFEGAQYYAGSLFASGQINTSQYKDFIEAASAQNSKVIEEVQGPSNLVRQGQAGLETSLKNVGDIITGTTKTISDVIGATDKLNKTMEFLGYAILGSSLLNSLTSLSGFLARVVGTGAAAGAAGSATGSGGLLAGLGGAGLIGAGTALGVGTAFAGTLVAATAGINEYQFSDAKSDNEKYIKSMYEKAERFEKNGDKIGAARSRLLALQALQSTEKAEDGNLTFGAASRFIFGSDTQSKINEQRKELENLQRNKSIEDAGKSALKLAQESNRIQSTLAKQTQLNQTNVNLLSLQSDLVGKTRLGAESLNKTYESLTAGLDKEIDLLTQAVSKYDEIKKSATTTQEINDAELLYQEASLKLVSAKLQKYQMLAQADASLTQSNKKEIEASVSRADVQRSYISLIDSAGVGAKAQISLRQQLISEVNNQISAYDQQILNEQNVIQDLQKKLQSGNISQDDREAAESRIYEAQIRLNQATVSRTNALKEQAEVSRTLREGWIDAIKFSVKGEGVFSRIVVDQNRRLGSLLASGPDKLNTFRTGGTTGGRLESTAFTTSGLRLGTEGVYEKGVLNQYGLGSGFNIYDVGEKVFNSQRNLIANNTQAASSVAASPFGVIAAIETGTAKGIERAASGDGKNAGVMILNETSIKQMQSYFVEAFKNMANAIREETIKSMKNGK